MHQHPDLPSALLHYHFLRRVVEIPCLHQLKKQGRVLAPRVGEEGLAARREQPGGEAREGRGVAMLVEHVGGEHEVEASEAPRIRHVPVDERRLQLAAQVRSGIVEGEVEGGLVVVGRENLRAAGAGDDAREPDTAAELDGALASKVFARQVPRQGDRARPELGPVRELFVALEVLLVQEGVRRGGVEDAVGPAPDPDEEFEQPGAATEVRSEFV